MVPQSFLRLQQPLLNPHFHVHVAETTHRSPDSTVSNPYIVVQTPYLAHTLLFNANHERHTSLRQVYFNRVAGGLATTHRPLKD